MKNPQLKAITRAVYVVRCTNNAFPKLYSCGAAGVRQGQNGNLLQRLSSHSRDRRSHVPKNGRQLYRHRVSPFRVRVWALNLTNWTELGVQLAEHALLFRLSLAFPFVDDSCFLADSDSHLLPILKVVMSDLQKIVAAGNSTASENNALLGLQAISPSAPLQCDMSSLAGTG